MYILITPLESDLVVAGVTAHHCELLVGLALLSVSYSMLIRRIERLRRGVTKGHVANSLDVWAVAGALLLPLPLVTALVLILYAAEWPARKAVAGGRPKRYLVSVGVNLLAALTGAQVHASLPGALGTLFAIVAWSVVNDAVLATVMIRAGQGAIARQVLSPRNHVFDIQTKTAGCLLAILLEWHLSASLLIAPVMMVLQRAALLDAIKRTRAYDSAAEMWRERAWRLQAQQLVDDAPAATTLLLIDPVDDDQQAAISKELRAAFGRSLEPTTASSDSHPQICVGHYGTRQVAVVIEVDRDGFGVLIAQDIRDRLAGARIDCVVGSSARKPRPLAITLRSDAELTLAIGPRPAKAPVDLETLLMLAGEDLMTRRQTAGVDARW